MVLRYRLKLRGIPKANPPFPLSAFDPTLNRNPIPRRRLAFAPLEKPPRFESIQKLCTIPLAGYGGAFMALTG